MPEPVQRRKRSYEESEAQQSVFKWWAITHKQFGVPECLLFAIPNGSALGSGKEDWQVKQRMIRGKRAKAEGSRPGVYDIFLSVPKGRVIGGRLIWLHGLFIEMKRRDGVLSPAQVEFKSAVEGQNYAATLCYTSGEAIDQITAYLK